MRVLALVLGMLNLIVAVLPPIIHWSSLLNLVIAGYFFCLYRSLRAEARREQEAWEQLDSLRGGRP